MQVAENVTNDTPVDREETGGCCGDTAPAAVPDLTPTTTPSEREEDSPVDATGASVTPEKDGDSAADTGPAKPVEINRKRGKGLQKYEWTEDMLCNLIDSWEAHEFLYDRGHEKFHNTRLKQEAIKKMAEELAVPGK